MSDDSGKITYVPGYYGKKRMSAAEWTNVHMKHWHQEEGSRKPEGPDPIALPSVCISRQIGVGALEIADMLGGLMDYRVVDRELLEQMAEDTKLSEKAIKMFDERYPGWASEFFTMLISQKTFIKSDYARQLVRTVTALADAGPTIFVGRGIHMVLPRQNILAVRILGSRKFREARLSNLLDIPGSKVSKKLDVIDGEQEKFFKRVYNKTATSPETFDLVINRDFISDAGQIARIVLSAFTEKFGSPSTTDK